MSTTWIGDFRCRLLPQIIENRELSEQNEFLLEDFATYSWFATEAYHKLEAASTSDYPTIIIMLGLIDCIHSCIWDSIKITTVAADYVKSINAIVDAYTTSKIYICSVNPVNEDYYSSLIESGYISKKDLNAKIKSFNDYIKDSCKAIYIDSYKYLSETGFSTYDGIHYTHATTEALFDFLINSQSGGGSVIGNTFKARLNAPVVESDGDSAESADDYWIHTSHGGENPFPLVNSTNGSTLPNCTAYAWGRFYEIIGTKPTLLTRNAEYWFLADGNNGYGDDGYKRGTEPALGAVICWQKGEIGGDGAGHVAIVEQINDDGSILTSESGWNSAEKWWLKKRTNSDGNWGAGSSYKFQGFIYCPAVTPTATAIDVTKSQVVTHTGYLKKSEMEINAKYIYKFLGSRGWTLNAVAGLLGNLEHESTINPGITQLGGGNAFGLVQWDPPTKFTKWCDVQNPPLQHDDVDSQLKRLEHDRDPTNSKYGVCMSGCVHGYWYRTKDAYRDNYAITFKPETLDEFATSTKTPSELAWAFLYNYECPGSICYGAYKDKATGRSAKEVGRTKTIAEREIVRAATRKARGECAEKWYNFLAPYAIGADMPVFTASTLKVDQLAATSATASFLVRLGASCQYKVYDSAERLVKNANITDKLNNDDDTLQVISFNIDSLTPNNTYKLAVTVKGKEAGEAILEVTFCTPQDYPKEVENIVLTTTDSGLLTATIKLEATALTSKDWGYWSKPSNGGYTVQLIVNGRLKAEKELSTLPKTFKLSSYFGYDVKIADIIQIGIRTWVKYDGKKLYDSEFAKTSNPIPMITKSTIAYLKNR